ncbi:MAG: TetR/AcrR family transcriptional regulator [Solirubrobacterales bacterium]
MPERGTAEQFERLPRGRHNLSRQEVEDSQRERMMRAMAEAVGEIGYVKTTVAEVLKRAGVSRETFYAQFSDKHDCFIAAFDRAASEMVVRLRAAVDDVAESGGTEEERISMMLASFLGLVAEEPGIARTYYVEVYAAGQEAIEHRVEIQMQMVDLMLSLISVEPEDRFTLQATMAGIGAVITQVISLGQTEHVVNLQPMLLKFVLSTLRGIDAELA